MSGCIDMTIHQELRSCLLKAGDGQRIAVAGDINGSTHETDVACAFGGLCRCHRSNKHRVNRQRSEHMLTHFHLKTALLARWHLDIDGDRSVLGTRDHTLILRGHRVHAVFLIGRSLGVVRVGIINAERITGEIRDIKVLEHQLHSAAFGSGHESDIALEIRAVVSVYAAVVVEHQTVRSNSYDAVIACLQVTHILHNAVSFGVSGCDSLRRAAECNGQQRGIHYTLYRGIGFDVRGDGKRIRVLCKGSRSLQSQRHLSGCGCLG